MDRFDFRHGRRATLVTIIIGAFIFLVAFHAELLPVLVNADLKDTSLPETMDAKPDIDMITTSEEEIPLQLEGNAEHNPFKTMFPERPSFEQEQFLGYIPHSGFHNQRIALENAVKLAAFLNRTLLLPPLYLCEKALNIPWSQPTELLRRWDELDKNGLDSCKDYNFTTHPKKTQKELRQGLIDPQRDQDMQCALYHAWTTVPWTYFYDLPRVINGVVHVASAHQLDPIRVYDRPNMTMQWLMERLDIGEDTGNDIFWINDTTRYDYLILDDTEYDFRNHPEPQERYERTLLLSDLRARQEKVIHFGSLYALDRIDIRTDAHYSLSNYTALNMDIWNQEILDATVIVENQIHAWSNITGRAVPGFFGIHFRTEDGGFAKLIDQNLRRIVEWVREMIEQDNREYIKAPVEIQAYTKSDIKKRQTVNNTTPIFLERCMNQPPESPLIFLATDVHHPRESPILIDFLNEFPCTMVLSDFPDSIEIIQEIYNTVDNVHMLPYMIALMDANMAAKGRQFQGTQDSTFTAYITSHLWPEYHPGEQPRIPFW